MLFTDAQIAHYKTQGYLSGPRVLSDDLYRVQTQEQVLAEKIALTR